MYSRTFSHVAAQALTPEQLVGYVVAVGESRPRLFADCVAYDFEGARTLVAYAPGRALDAKDADAVMNRAVAAALADGECDTLTVLGPARPADAPADAASRKDAYAFLPLPLDPPGQKLRNMLRRGKRECVFGKETWGSEHAALARSYIESRPLEAGARHIYGRIEHYLKATPDAVLFAARDKTTSRLHALAIGDFSGLIAAFYMFAFRTPSCPPGAADALLELLAREAEARGHQYLNLGLGVNKGIANFKRKWGKAVFLPCVQTAWNARTTAGRSASPKATKPDDPLAVFTPPSLKDNLRRFFIGETRPFDCLQIETTSHCPGKCGYCPHTTKRGVWRSRTMEHATFAALLPLIRRAKRVHLQGWGEPLLHPGFFDFAAAAVRVGCNVSTTTYGLGVNAETAKKLVAVGMDIIAFSLTGVSEAGNAARAGVSFSKAIEGIAALNKARREAGSEFPRTHLAYLMLAGREAEVKGLPALMEKLGAPAAVVSTLDYIAAPGMEKDAYAPHETEKIERARTILRTAAKEAAARGGIIHYSLPGTQGRADCSEHVRTCMYIDAEGRIAPCVYVNLPTDEDDPHRRVFGSALEKDPLAVWNDPAYARFRRRLAEGDPDLPCEACPKRFERLY